MKVEALQRPGARVRCVTTNHENGRPANVDLTPGEIYAVTGVIPENPVENAFSIQVVDDAGDHWFYVAHHFELYSPDYE